MEIKVTLEQASLDDVVASTYDYIEEAGEEVTLRQVVVGAVIKSLMADHERWERLAGRFERMLMDYFRSQKAGVLERAVQAEVTRQIEDTRAGAVVHGKPGTKLHAYVATEVTTQLRAACAPAVEMALAELRTELGKITAEAVAGFREGLRKP